ncbi:MAG: nucleoside deaminase [Chloroflexaceae bacterium]|nr:nucleoside deaminase [Chloroflexaceae bacterium]
MTPKELMQAAIAAAKQGDMPFGAVLVKGDRIVATGYNTTQTDSDPTAHAEINALRNFTKASKTYSLSVLKGYTLYATCEPCPMCAAACVWTGVSEIVFGASIQDLMAIGISQIDLPCATVVAQGFQMIKVSSGLLAADCLALFQKNAP